MYMCFSATLWNTASNDEIFFCSSSYKEQCETLCNVLFFVFIFRIDPYRGNVRRELPWGATLNHSRKNANVRPFIANKNSRNPRVFLVALHDIAETVELLWDYNDKEWALYSNSQTLPQ